MKKILTPFICVMALLLTSCTLVFGNGSSSEISSSQPSSSEPSSSEEPSSDEPSSEDPSSNEPSSEEPSSSEPSSEDPSSSEPSSEEPSSSEPVSEEPSSSSEPSSEEKVIKKHQVFDDRDAYRLGEVFINDNNLKVLVTYTDGSTDVVDIEGLAVTTIRYKSTSKIMEIDSPFLNSGEYEIFYSYMFNNAKRNTKITVDVLNGLASGLNLVELTMDGLDYIIGRPILETSEALTFNALWDNGITETLPYDTNSEYIEISLYQADNLGLNVIDLPVEQDKDYIFTANIIGLEELGLTHSFTTPTALGYYRLEQGEILFQDFSTTSPYHGVANMLVIPIEISARTTTYRGLTWSDTEVEFANTLFFGDKESTPNKWNSLKSYYETTSLGMIEIDGVVAPVYRPSLSEFTMEGVRDSYDTLHNLFNSAIENTKELCPEIDWTQYDLNNDGFIDNLHFITNAPYNSNFSNDQALWPHKWEMYGNAPGTNDNPNGYVYETSSLGHFSDARTIIHEQGHMFGIPDYYDYSYIGGVDYVGCLDMQSHNVMDWNSWSKFSVGWGKPIIIDGTLDTVTVSLRSAALYNEFIVVPADINTYNNSAFDEFFLIELFTKDGNNYDDWINLNTAETAGVRLYHVDGRLFDSKESVEVKDKQQVEEIMESSYYPSIDLGANNSYYYYDYATAGNPEWSDYKLLALIQKGGIDTFGDREDNYGAYNYLAINDLFRTGDKFTFEKYGHFLSKYDNTVTTMDNGETFPYTIDFLSVTQEEAIIRFSK